MASGHEVTLHVYDLSGGMAMALSQSLLGKQLDGIWHTGIVVYGIEYYYGGGLQAGVPGATPYGVPRKTHSLGTTTKSKSEFETWLSGVNSSFTPASYHLLTNNCNHFTSQASMFLTGTDIPDYVSQLPAEFLSTPLGQMMRPMIDSVMGGMGGALGESVNSTSSAVPSAPSAPSAPTTALMTTTPRVYASLNAKAVTRHLAKCLAMEKYAAAAADVCGLVGSVDRLNVWIGTLKVSPSEAARDDVDAFVGLVSELATTGLVGDDVFAALDVLRVAVLHPSVGGSLLVDPTDTRFEETWVYADGGVQAKHAELMVYRGIANALSHDAGWAYVSSAGASDERLGRVIALLLGGVADGKDSSVAGPAAAGIHNLCLCIDGADLSDAYVSLVAGLVQTLSAVDLATVPDLVVLHAKLAAVAHLVRRFPATAGLVVQLGLSSQTGWLVSAANPPAAVEPGTPASGIVGAASFLLNHLS